MANSPLDYSVRDEIAVFQFDDGKANALSHQAIEALHKALDQAEGEAKAVLLAGRPGRFSAGFDLTTMRGGPEAARGLVQAGAELLLRMYTYPLPVVAACTGHALAAGAILLLVSDQRVGVEGDFKIGLNEVAIGMALPIFAVELARDRLAKPHFSEATVEARIFSPQEAAQAGFLDEVTTPERLLDQAMEIAKGRAALPGSAFGATKQTVRADTVRRIRETLDEDMNRISGPN